MLLLVFETAPVFLHLVAFKNAPVFLHLIASKHASVRMHLAADALAALCGVHHRHGCFSKAVIRPQCSCDGDWSAVAVHQWGWGCVWGGCSSLLLHHQRPELVLNS